MGFSLKVAGFRKGAKLPPPGPLPDPISPLPPPPGPLPPLSPKVAGFRKGAKLPPAYLYQMFGEDKVKLLCGNLLSEEIQDECEKVANLAPYLDSCLAPYLDSCLDSYRRRSRTNMKRWLGLPLSKWPLGSLAGPPSLFFSFIFIVPSHPLCRSASTL